MKPMKNPKKLGWLSIEASSAERNVKLRAAEYVALAVVASLLIIVLALAYLAAR